MLLQHNIKRLPMILLQLSFGSLVALTQSTIIIVIIIIIIVIIIKLLVHPSSQEISERQISPGSAILQECANDRDHCEDAG